MNAYKAPAWYHTKPVTWETRVSKYTVEVKGNHDIYFAGSHGEAQRIAISYGWTLTGGILHTGGAGIILYNPSRHSLPATNSIIIDAPASVPRWLDSKYVTWNEFEQEYVRYEAKVRPGGYIANTHLTPLTPLMPVDEAETLRRIVDTIIDSGEYIGDKFVVPREVMESIEWT